MGCSDPLPCPATRIVGGFIIGPREPLYELARRVPFSLPVIAAVRVIVCDGVHPLQLTRGTFEIGIEHRMRQVGRISDGDRWAFCVAVGAGCGHTFPAEFRLQEAIADAGVADAFLCGFVSV
jgi:hypothetical protein